MLKPTSIKNQIILSLLAGIILGAILSIFSSGEFLLGWLGMGFFSAILIFGMLRTWSYFGCGRVAAILMITAFFLRIILGSFLYLALPVVGFDTDVQNAGYVYSDAHKRDIAAFNLSSSQDSWFEALEESRSADQYGGLLLISAAIYRIFSPDAHRPLILLLFTAFMMAIGVAFFYSAVRQRWSERIALISSLVFVLYPDSLLLGSSQMREPLLVGLAGIAFWGCMFWKAKPLRTALLVFVILAVSSFISIPAGILFFIVLAGMIFLEWNSRQSNRILQAICWGVILIFFAIGAWAGWMWLKPSMFYDLYQTQSSSGWISELLLRFGERIRLPFITIYGLTQPLLPAVLIEPSLPIWMGIGIFRAAGWYFVLPFMIYGLFALLSKIKIPNRSVMLWFMFAFLVWALISSLRAGGDQWDNPRYRTLFLPWLSLLVGWVWDRLLTGKHPWFWRWVAVEVAALLVFLNWYINRYYNIGTQIWFPYMIAIIVAFSVILFVIGALVDKKRSLKH